MFNAREASYMSMNSVNEVIDNPSSIDDIISVRDLEPFKRMQDFVEQKIIASAKEGETEVYISKTELARSTQEPLVTFESRVIFPDESWLTSLKHLLKENDYLVSERPNYVIEDWELYIRW